MKSQAIMCGLMMLCITTLSMKSSSIKESSTDYVIEHIEKSSNSVACFGSHTSGLRAVEEAYKKNLDLCYHAVDKEIDVLLEEGAKVRENITFISSTLCTLFTHCNEEGDNFKFFDCFAKLEYQDVLKAYTVVHDVSVIASEFHEKYLAIDVKHETCKRKMERLRVIKIANIHHELSNCLSKSSENPSTTEEPEEGSTNDEDEEIENWNEGDDTICSLEDGLVVCHGVGGK